MKQTSSVPYTCSDAWLLLSVVIAGSNDGATLEGIVSAGDGVNHAIFTFPEIDGGLARLLAGEYVSPKAEKIYPTAKALTIYEQVQKRGGSICTQMERMARKIGAPAWSASHDPNQAAPAWSLGRFSSEDLEHACAQYIRQFAAATKRLGKQGR